MKKLAYEIKKKPRGYYLRIDYGGEGAVVDEIERFCRIDDRVLKYMTVLQDETVDVEKIKAELAATKAQKAPTVATEAPVEKEETPAAEKAAGDSGTVDSAEGDTPQTEADKTPREESE
jgi:small subunit ribosomal protein S6